MKILYGVVGEGMGHAMRSRVVLEHLVEQGHEVEIMASGSATDYLAKRFDGVNRIHGLHMIYDENRVRKGKTLWSNVLAGALGIPKNIAAYFDLIDDFARGGDQRLRVVDVPLREGSTPADLLDRQHADHQPLRAARTRSRAATRRDFPDRQGVREGQAALLRSLPGHDLLPTPHPQARNDLLPPILRPEILAAKAVSHGEHLLVYQTGEGNDALVER
jgi:hypothetical protein